MFTELNNICILITANCGLQFSTKKTWFTGCRQDKATAYRFSNKWIKNIMGWIKRNCFIFSTSELGAAFVVGRVRTVNVRVPFFIHFHIIFYATQWKQHKILILPFSTVSSGKQSWVLMVLDRKQGIQTPSIIPTVVVSLPPRCFWQLGHFTGTRYTAFTGENRRRKGRISKAAESTVWRRRRWKRRVDPEDYEH